MSLDLSDLNDAQRHAVTAPDGAHLVIAGAGTGKTRTLVHRVAWLVEQGVPPEGIVLLTFTRRAAAEMLERCARLVGPAARRVRGGTFHGFANTALRRFARSVGYDAGFTILDRGDAESLVGLVRADLGLGGRDRRFARKGTILNVLSRATNTGASVAEVLEADFPQYADDAEDFVRVGEGYAERKRKQGVVDFDDLLVLLAQLLRDDVDARRTLSHAARHVLVDEYQDVNRLQAQIAGLLASVHGNLMVVGDEAQAIYGFRGADVENILLFPQVFPEALTTVLETNYRSTQPVLDLANGVLESFDRGFRKRLTSAKGEGPLPVLLDVGDEHAQAQVVVSRILELREQGTGLDAQAVLFRASHHANLLEFALADAGIPYRKYGGTRFSEAAHVKDVFALLRLVVNPRDVIAWMRVLSWMPGVGAKTADRIASTVADAATPVLQPAAYKGRKYHGHLVSLAALLADAGAEADHVQVALDRVLAWYRERIGEIHEDWKGRVRDLDTLPLLAERFHTLEGFLADVALDPVERADVDAPDDDEVLTLSTVHSAKGLEWDAVHVVQLSDGSFPSPYALDDDADMEEERRLFYVAVTRARRWLHLVAPRFVRGRRGPAFGPGCRLLDDIGHLDDLVDVVFPDSRPTYGAPVGDADEDEVARIARLLGFFER